MPTIENFGMQITLEPFKMNLDVCGMSQYMEDVSKITLSVADSALFIEHSKSLRDLIEHELQFFEYDNDDDGSLIVLNAIVPLVTFRHKFCNSLTASGQQSQLVSDLLERLFDNTRIWCELGADIICISDKE